jgi:hypothetical protein
MKGPLVRRAYIDSTKKMIKLCSRYALQIVLWMLWTLAVIATAFYQWHHDTVRDVPLNVIGLIIHCLLVGAVGTVVLVLIEFWLELAVPNSSQ